MHRSWISANFVAAVSAWCLIMSTPYGLSFTTPRVAIDSVRRHAPSTNSRPRESFASWRSGNRSGNWIAAVPWAALAFSLTTRCKRLPRPAMAEHQQVQEQDCASGRRALLTKLGFGVGRIVASTSAAAVAGVVAPCFAQDNKQRNLPPEQLAAIIEKDVSERAFMVSADLTRSVYDEKCTFTDEIDTYEIDKFIKGTKALFLGPPYSRLSLTSPVEATDTDVKFTFSEDLVFNIPFKPVMSLTGRMQMKRGPDGLITSYREFWDGGVPKVLSTVRLSGY